MEEERLEGDWSKQDRLPGVLPHLRDACRHLSRGARKAPGREPEDHVPDWSADQANGLKAPEQRGEVSLLNWNLSLSGEG
jgi:hypothetical protein